MRSHDDSIGQGGVEGKDLIWHNDDTSFTWNINSPSKRLAMRFPSIRFDKIIAANEADVFADTALQFERSHEVADHECVFEEKPPHSLISSRPVHALKWHVEVSAKSACASGCEAIDEAFGAAVMVVVELTAGPLQIAVMVEEIETAKKLLTTAAD